MDFVKQLFKKDYIYIHNLIMFLIKHAESLGT